MADKTSVGQMKKLFLTGIAVLFLATGAEQAQTHDADFPAQMNAIVGKSPAPMPKEELIACMEAQNFRFCDDCQIFRYSGGPCRDDKENGPDRATCWRPAQAQQKEKWETNFRRCQIEKHGDDDDRVITPEDVPDIMRALKELKKCAAFWQCVDDRERVKVKHCYE